MKLPYGFNKEKQTVPLAANELMVYEILNDILQQHIGIKIEPKAKTKWVVKRDKAPA